MATIINGVNLLLLVQVKAVQKEFPHCSFVWEREQEAFFEWWVSTETQNARYQMRLYVNPTLPEVCPALYVWAPVTLRRMPSGTINRHSPTQQYSDPLKVYFQTGRATDTGALLPS